MAVILGMLSLYFNIQHYKSSSSPSSSHAPSFGENRAPYGNDDNNKDNNSASHIGTIGVINGGPGGLKMAHITTGVEMAKVSSSSRRGSRSGGKGRRHKSSRHDDGGGGGGGGGGVAVDACSACRVAGRSTRDSKNGHTRTENSGEEPNSCRAAAARTRVWGG